MKIGVMFGNPETTTGGNALKFYSSVRLEVRKIETIEKGDEDAIGNRVRVKVVKNKVAPPFRKAEIEIMFGKGMSFSGSLIDAAIKYNLIEKKGAWFSYGEEKIGQGRDNAKLFIESNPDISHMLETKLREMIFPGINSDGSRSKAAEKASSDRLEAFTSKAAGEAAPATVPAAAAKVEKAVKVELGLKSAAEGKRQKTDEATVPETGLF